jgi:hypothetical protein
MDYGDLSVIALKVIQEQQALIEKQQTIIEQLEAIEQNIK